MKKLLILFALIAPPLMGQSVRMNWNVYTINSSAPLPGALYPVLASTSARINICHAPATGFTVLNPVTNTISTGCTNYAQTYTNAAQSGTCTAPTQLTRTSSTTCVGTADAEGGFGAWLPAGTYQYTVTLSYGSFGPYDFTVGGSGGGGCPPGGIPDTAVLHNASGNCAGDTKFTYNPSFSNGLVNISQGAAFQVSGINTDNDVFINGDQVILTNDGSDSATGSTTMIPFAAHQSDSAYSGPSDNILDFDAQYEIDHVGAGATGFLTEPAVGTAAAGTLVSYESGALSTDGGTADKFYGFLGGGAGDQAVTEEFTFFANTVQNSLVGSNYCDFMGRTRQVSPVLRESIGCGPTATSTFGGPVNVNDGTGGAGFFGLHQGTAQSTVANEIGFTAPTSVTAYNMIFPGAQGTGALTNDGAGNLSWTASGGGTPGGSNTQIQYNNSGAFGGANLTWNGTTLGMITGKQFFGNGTHDVGTIYDYQFTNSGATLAGTTFENALEINYVPNNSASTVGKTMQAFESDVNPSSSNPMGDFVANSAGVFISGSGTFQEARGIDVSASEFGNGGGDALFGVDSGIANFGSGTVTNAYGYMVQSGQNSGGGAITNLYGNYIKAQTAGTNSWNLFSAGATTHNTMEGDLKVGFGSTPSNVCTQATGCSGGTTTVKYVSQLGCAQDATWDTRTGTDAGPCISAALAAATPTSRMVVIQDGVSAVSTITGPDTGNWELDGTGGGFYSVDITNCAITSNVATFTTKPQTLAAGKVLTVGGFVTACTALNNQRVTVNSSGLTSTSFTANFTTANSATHAEVATASYLTGTGFIHLAANVNTVGLIHTLAIDGCSTGLPVVSQKGGNVTLSNFVMDGNSDNNYGTFCLNVFLPNMDHVVVDNVLSYSPAAFNFAFANNTDVKINGITVLDKFPGIDMSGGTVKDGIHIYGLVSDVNISNIYLRTNDDSIAINPDELFGGAVSNINVVNGIVDNSSSMFRIDTSSTASLTTVSHVHFVNYGGTAYSRIGFIGNATGSTGDETLSDFTWSDSTVSAPLGFQLEDSVHSMALNNFKWRMVTGAAGNSLGEWFILPNYAINAGFISFQNVTQEIENSGLGGFGIGLSRGTGISSGLLIGNFYIDQYNATCGLAPTTPASCGYPSPSFINSGGSALAITNLTAGVVSNANITSFVTGGVANTTTVSIPGLGTTNQTLVMGTGLGIANAGGVVLIPGAGGTDNSTLDYGAHYGKDAIDMYHSGSSIFGWGLNAGQMQFYLGDPTGTPTSNFTFNNGPNGLQPDGTNEFLRLNTPTNRLTMSSGGLYGWTNTNIAGGGSAGTCDTAFSRDAAGVVDVGNCTAGNTSGTIKAATGTFGTSATVAGNSVYAPVSNAVTSATGGSGTGTVTCATASCTNLRGSYTVAGGTFATGTLLTLVWPTTTTAYVCSASVLNNATGASIGYHSIATATGMTLSSLTAATGLNIDIDYSCQP